MVIHWHAFLLLRSCCPTDPADDKVYIHKQSAAALPRTAFPSSSLSKSLLSPPLLFPLLCCLPHSAGVHRLLPIHRFPFSLPATCTLPSALRGSSLHTRTNTPSVLCLRSAAHHPTSGLYLSSEYFSPQSVSASISFSPLSCCLSPSLPLPLSL